jgi:hypothetical protein
MKNPLTSVKKRLAPLSAEQHVEIERLIRSSMDTRAKNPTPFLTCMGRLVVRREITTLARCAGVRRLKGHAAAFSRALSEFERSIAAGVLSPTKERTGRLAIEHLWRWLHGYTRPQPSAEELQAERNRWAEEDHARKREHDHKLFEELRAGFTLVIPNANGESHSYEIPAEESPDDEWPDVIGRE